MRGLLLTNDTTPGANPPVNLTLPVMSGNGQAGDVISWDDGTWSGDLPMTFAYRLNRDGVLYIDPATKPYTCLAGDIGKQLTVDVTATNAVSSTTARNVIPLFGVYRTTRSGAPPTLIHAGAGNNNREMNHAHVAPDGSGRIAYTRYNLFNGDGTPNPPNVAIEGASYLKTEIVMFDPSTGIETVLVPAVAADINANPVWWPDSSKIIFIRKIGAGISSIGQYTFSNGLVSNLYTSPDINMSDPHVASNASFIVMSGATSVGGQPRSQLYIYNISTGVRTQLTTRVFPDFPSGSPGYFDAHINPSRTKIASIAQMLPGIFQIIITSISGTQTNLGELVIPQVGSPSAFTGVPEWTQDGTDLIVFWCTDPQDRSTDGFYYMNADGTGRTRIPLPPEFYYNTVAWQPGGGSGPNAPIIFSAQGLLPIYQAKPVALTVPTIAGTAQDGQILHATTGTYANGTNLGIGRQWKADTALATGPGATTLDYTQVPMDVGHRMTIEEQGKNSGGWSAPNISAPTAVVISAGGFDDGIAGAPAGTPQYPTILNIYGANRPPWNVAGVDYHVGIPTGTTLTDWRTLPGANLSTGQVSPTSGTNFTFDSIDFSLGIGGWIYHGGGVTNLTVSNNKFGKCAASNYAIQDQAGVNLILFNNEFDGIQMIGGSAFVTFAKGIVARYNRFLHGKQHVFEQVRFPSTTSPQAILTAEYNLFDDYAIGSGAHANCFQETGSQSNPAPDSVYTIRFNTFYHFTTPPSAPGEDIQVEPNSSNGVFRFTSPVIQNNTMIARRTGADTGFKINSYFIHGANTASFPVTNGLCNDNYFDPTDTIPGNSNGAFFPGTMIPSVGWTSSGNKNMLDGSIITPA